MSNATRRAVFPLWDWRPLRPKAFQPRLCPIAGDPDFVVLARDDDYYHHIVGGVVYSGQRQPSLPATRPEDGFISLFVHEPMAIDGKLHSKSYVVHGKSVPDRLELYWPLPDEIDALKRFNSAKDFRRPTWAEIRAAIIEIGAPLLALDGMTVKDIVALLKGKGESETRRTTIPKTPSSKVPPQKKRGRPFKEEGEARYNHFLATITEYPEAVDDVPFLAKTIEADETTVRTWLRNWKKRMHDIQSARLKPDPENAKI